jgi:hypothetical protein
MATFNIKCGICGQDMAVKPDVSEDGGLVFLATCPGCQQMNKVIGDLEDTNFDLAVELGKYVRKELSHEN